MLPNATVAEKNAEGIHPVASMTSGDIPLPQLEYVRGSYGVTISMKPTQLPIPTTKDTAIPDAVRSNKNHKASAAKAMTAYNCT